MHSDLRAYISQAMDQSWTEQRREIQTSMQRGCASLGLDYQPGRYGYGCKVQRGNETVFSGNYGEAARWLAREMS